MCEWTVAKKLFGFLLHINIVLMSDIKDNVEEVFTAYVPCISKPFNMFNDNIIENNTVIVFNLRVKSKLEDVLAIIYFNYFKLIFFNLYSTKQ